MPLNYVLYGFALLLLLYIIVSIARTRKFKTGDAIATLGIIVSIMVSLRSDNPPTIIPFLVSTTPTPQFVARIFIPSNTTSGLVFRATRTGLYSFQNIDSACSIGNGSWSTLIHAFRGTQGRWNNDGIPNSEATIFSIGSMQYDSPQSAINSSKSQIKYARLNEGEALTLIVADLSDYYSDNIGEIALEVKYIP